MIARSRGRSPLRTDYLLLVLILIIRLLAAGWFAYHTPLWEKSDEINHYHYIDFIIRENRLPAPADYPDDWPHSLRILSQLNQPPLYYLLLTPVIRAIDSGPMMPVYPDAVPVCAGLMPFKHYFIHTQAEQFPWKGTVLAVWAGRGLTMLMGLGSIVLLWGATRLLWPDDRRLALLAAALLAVMPCAVELTTWINNDGPLMLFGAAVLLGLAYVHRHLNSLAGWAILLIATGLCVGTKLNGLAVVPVVVLFILARVVGRNPRRMILLAALLSITAGAFVFYNYQQCGLVICRLHRYTPAYDSLDTFVGTLRSDIFLGAYRHFLSTAAAPWINDAYRPAAWMLVTGLTVLMMGLSGLAARYIFRREDRRLLLLLASLPVSALALANLRVWWLQVGYMHVRYIAVAMPALALLLAIGYEALAHVFMMGAMRVLPVGALLILTVLIPPLLYGPVFTPPERYDRLPGGATLVPNYRFENGIQVAGYTMHTGSDGLAGLRLYMGTDRALEEPLFLMVSTLDASGQRIEQCGGTAGNAFWSTLDWRPGEWIAQDFILPRLDQASAFEVALYRLQNQYSIVNSYDPARPEPRTSGAMTIHLLNPHP